MYTSEGFVSLTVTITLLGLLVTGGIVVSRVQTLALPISNVTAAASLILPVVTAASFGGLRALTPRFLKRRGVLKLNAGIIFIVLLAVYDTIIATLGVTSMTPASTLRCQLQDRWGTLFSAKNADMIRRIQDLHQCCGLFSAHDRAWPFPDRDHTAAACQEAFGRTRGCFEGWRRDEQVTGGMMLLIAMVAFFIQLLTFLLYRVQSRGETFAWGNSSLLTNNEAGQDGNAHRRIEGAYHDERAADTNTEGNNFQSHSESEEEVVHTGPAVQPSRLQAEGNEWR